MDGTTVQILGLIGTVLGTGTFLTVIARGIIAQVSGKAQRQRLRDGDLLTRVIAADKRAADADRRADEADKKRRLAMDYASGLRGELIEQHSPVPDWPDELDRTVTKAELRKIKKENP
jgi:hypothetical protein